MDETDTLETMTATENGKLSDPVKAAFVALTLIKSAMTQIYESDPAQAKAMALLVSSKLLGHAKGLEK